MNEKEDRYKEIDNLLNRITNEKNNYHSPITLRQKFDQRVAELGITPTYVLEILKINYRALEGILDATQKRIDFVTLSKLARFLSLPIAELVILYMESLERNNIEDLEDTDKRAFITANFDLSVLRTMGVINSINDFEHIEEKINSILGLSSIFEYNDDDLDAAFSTGAKKPKNLHTRIYFVRKSRKIFKLISNPFKYDKQALVDYFPKIRWHSTDVEHGLPSVIRSLYELGVTIIYQPKMPSLHLRGATIAVDEKPCIVLTDYRGYYPTLWFALIHELFHVLFDWTEILNNEYHLSDEENDLFILQQKENEANDFAREYLFPKKKMDVISCEISKKAFIKEYAYDHNVHPSIIYANYAHDNSTPDNQLWSSFRKYMPDIAALLKMLGHHLGAQATASQYAAYYKTKIF